MLRKAWAYRHLVMAIVWGLLAIPTLLWWKDAIVWVAMMSIYANAEASLAAHNASRQSAPAPE